MNKEEFINKFKGKEITTKNWESKTRVIPEIFTNNSFAGISSIGTIIKCRYDEYIWELYPVQQPHFDWKADVMWGKYKELPEDVFMFSKLGVNSWTRIINRHPLPSKCDSLVRSSNLISEQYTPTTRPENWKDYYGEDLPE